MKKLILLILSFIPLWGFSQYPFPFVESNATWNVARTHANGSFENPSFIETTTKVYGFKGDTLIGNHEWLKFYCTYDQDFSTGFIYLGNLREENGIVQFMNTENSIDTIYNFNLQVNDSLVYEFGFGNYYLKIEAIDSIEIDGVFRKRFQFEAPNYQPSFLNEVWI